MSRRLKEFESLSKRHRRRRLLSEVGARMRITSRANEGSSFSPNENVFSADAGGSTALVGTISSDCSDVAELSSDTSFASDTSFSSDTSNDSSIADDVNICELLAQWAITENVEHSKVNSLLKILRKLSFLTNRLPADSRTLLRTPRTVELDTVGRGSYHHIGLENSLVGLLKRKSFRIRGNIIRIQINVDGTPLSKSSCSQFWPILGGLSDFKGCEVFVIGLYHGYEKPCDVDSFFFKFIQEANYLQTNGFEFEGKVYTIDITGLICDAPARAFVTQIKGHTGYFGCGKCKVAGTRYKRRVCYLEDSAALRSDADVLDPLHNTGVSPLRRLLGVGNHMVSKFPFEYMHLVCLGVMRKIIHLMFKGNVNVRLPSFLIDKLSGELIRIAPFISRRDFARKPRSLKEYTRFKATEFRQILLYSGPLVFKNILSQPVYDNFLVLHYCLRSLVSEKPCVPTSYVSELLKNFVQNFSVLYGRENVSYNVHGLLHLTKDYEIHGSLDSYSAFRFENKLQSIKKMLRKGDRPIKQLVKRLGECSSVTSLNNVDEKTVNVLSQQKFPFHCDFYFDKFSAEVGILENKPPNNCVILKSREIVFVKAIGSKEGSLLVIGNLCQAVTPFFNEPETSVNVHVYRAGNISTDLHIWPLHDVHFKAVALPLHESSLKVFYVAAILHQPCKLHFVCASAFHCLFSTHSNAMASFYPLLSGPDIFVYFFQMYTLVEFLSVADNGKISTLGSTMVVPSKWITQTAYGAVCVCPAKNPTISARKGVDPGANWKSYPVKEVIEYASYEEANKKQNVYLYSSNLESSEHECEGKERKRVSKPTTRYSPARRGSSDDDESEVDPLPVTSKLVPAPKRVEAEIPMVLDTIENSSDHADTRTYCGNGDLQLKDLIKGLLEKNYEALQSNYHDITLKIVSLEKQMESLVRENSALRAEIREKSRGGDRNVAIEDDINILESLPLNEKAEFAEFNALIGTNKEAARSLRRLLKRCLTKDLSESVYSMLRKILSGSLAEQMNWLGHNGKMPFREGLCLISAVTGVLQDSAQFKDRSEKEVKNVIQAYLKSAKTRRLQSEKRKAVRMVQAHALPQHLPASVAYNEEQSIVFEIDV